MSRDGHAREKDGGSSSSKPSLRNLIEHETARGYRTFELWEGDITDPGFPVDILVVSYAPGFSIVSENSVVRALHSRYGINVRQLVEQDGAEEYDLRQPLGVWLSRELTTGQDLPFNRVLCINTVDRHIEETLDNVFASLALFEAKKIKIGTFALPLFGTGGTRYQCGPDFILKHLLPTAKDFMERSLTLERVAFFGYKPAIVNQLDEAMNQILGRSLVEFPKNSLITGLCNDMTAAFQSSMNLVEERHLPLLREFQSVLRRHTVRSFEIGILGRRAAEMIISDLLGSKGNGGTLARQIDKLRKQNEIAGWIISYFEVLRNLGNESAHETHAGKLIPAVISEDDLTVGLSCVLRLWKFWVGWKTRPNLIPDRKKSDGL